MTDQHIAAAVEAERMVLSAMMHGATEAAAQHLTPGDFYEHRHSVLYNHLLELWGANEETTPAALLKRLSDRRQLTRPETAPYLHDLQELAVSPLQVGYYAQIVLDEADRRRTAALAAKLAQAAEISDSEARQAKVTEILAQVGTNSPPEASHLQRLRVALVDTDGLDGLEDPEPLIGEEILFRDSLNWMVGKPGCMKSFTALDMAGCVATGTTWQGHPVAKGDVLYLVAEGVRGTKKRVRAWEASLRRRMTGVQFLPVAVQSKNAAQWDALVELAAELQPTMVVIDTQARVTVGVEENSNSEMGEFVHQAERLRAASAACVVIVHHIGRNGDTGRGATTLDGALSTVIKVAKDDDKVTLECQKNKDGAEWDDIDLRAVPFGDSLVLMPHDGESHSSTSVGSRKWVRDWWNTHEDELMSPTTLIDTVVTKSVFHRDKLALVKSGLVVKDGKGRAVRYKLVRNPDSG